MRYWLGCLTMFMLLTGACLSDPAPTAWLEHAPMHVARSEHPAAVVNDQIVVIGGLVEGRPGTFGATDSVAAYDPATNRWSELAPLPEARHHSAAANVNGRLIVVGGFDSSGFRATDTVWELVDDEWVDLAPLPAPLASGAAVVMDDALYVVGGVPSSPLLRFDVDNNRWLALADPPEPREHLAAAVLDGEIWMLGGRWNADAVRDVAVYDPTTDQWREGPPMRERRSGFGAAVTNGSIVVVGGEVLDPLTALRSAEILSGGDWSNGPALDVGIHGHPLVEHAGALYLPGGSVQPNGVDNPGWMRSIRTP